MANTKKVIEQVLGDLDEVINRLNRTLEGYNDGFYTTLELIRTIQGISDNAQAKLSVSKANMKKGRVCLPSRN